MNLVLGVDGGNTKTIALVAQTDGTILGCGRGGCSDLYGAPSADAALEQAESAVLKGLHDAQVAPHELLIGAFSMAGADWPEDFSLLESAMAQRGFGRRAIVVNDAMGALRAGSADGTGVAVVCGTGAAVGARGPDGRTWHSSWWQETQGSRHLAHKALNAVYRAELGIDPPTKLTARALAIFDRDTVEEVLYLFTSRTTRPRPDVAPFTWALLEEAAGGDATAQRIVDEHGTALGKYAEVAARRVGLAGAPFTLVLAGGVLRHSCPFLPRAIVEQVRTSSPEARPTMSRYEPVVGALFLALEAVGVTIDHHLLQRVEATLPSAALLLR
jgi:N-acetylglucosamine kinase-like BadF-type ATPase